MTGRHPGLRRVSAAGAVAVALVAAVCAGCGSAASSVPDYEVRAIEVAGAGTVLADGGGNALYVYLPDQARSPRCTSVCATAWPPLVLPHGVARPVSGPDIDSALLGVVQREDGARQVTYDGWPLYRYIDDAPGEVTGQGEGMGAWYLIAPSGSVDRRPVAGSG